LQREIVLPSGYQPRVSPLHRNGEGSHGPAPPMATLPDLLHLPSEQVVVVCSGKVRLHFLRQILLAKYGAEWIIQCSRSKPGFRLGISNGPSVARILDTVPRRSVKDLVLFPMNFTNSNVDFPISSTSLISSFLYRHHGYGVSWDTTSEKEVFSAMLLADAALLGIGGFVQDSLYIRMIRSVLGESTVSTLREKGIIGDFNYHLLDQKGNQVAFPEIVTDIGDETTGALVKSIGLSILRERADRGCKIMIATTGEHKAPAAIAAFRNRYANCLLTDETVANKILCIS